MTDTTLRCASCGLFWLMLLSWTIRSSPSVMVRPLVGVLDSLDSESEQESLLTPPPSAMFLRPGSEWTDTVSSSSAERPSGRGDSLAGRTWWGGRAIITDGSQGEEGGTTGWL